MSDKTKQIQEVIAKYCGVKVEQVEANPKLADLNVDSLDMVEMVMEVEDALCTEIADFDAYDPSVTVNELIGLIEKHSGAPA
jgi:acyl carrier protein